MSIHSYSPAGVGTGSFVKDDDNDVRAELGAVYEAATTRAYLDMMLQEMAAGRHIAGITTANAIITTYKDGGRRTWRRVTTTKKDKVSPSKVSGTRRMARKKRETKKSKRQRGGALARHKPFLVDKIAEGDSMSLSGSSPRFLTLSSQAFKGVNDNVNHSRRRPRQR